MKRVLQFLIAAVAYGCTLSAQPTHTFTGSVDTAWVRYYGSGLILSDEEAIAIAIDDSGNIYVTGITNREDVYWWGQGSMTSGDITTMKYTSNGDVAWMRTYDSPDKGPDIPSSIAVDPGGNVYVTGLSGWEDDYVTIKYSPSGDTLWIRHFSAPVSGNAAWDGPTALVVDVDGNVYVTGISTMKYSSSGDMLWVRNFVGSYTSSLALDAIGNVYVTGTSTIKFSPSGDTLWVRNFVGGYATDLAVDAGGNVYVTGVSTIKFSSSGDTLWVRDNGYALAVDAGGNVYVMGGSITKYSSSGDTLWVRNVSGGGTNALATDVSGNLFVTGTSMTKYSPSGDTLWIRHYSEGSATALGVDASGNVAVTGWSSYQTKDDYVTIKYSSSGDTLWVRRYGGFGSGRDAAVGHVVDAGGNVHVTGSSWSGTSWDYATVKYSSTGDLRWVRRYNGMGNNDDGASAIVLDDIGNVIVTGTSYVDSTSQDYATIKYTPSGDTLWIRHYNGPGNGTDQAIALAVDAGGNVYVTGRSWSDTSWDYATIKYSPSGNTLWVRRYDGRGSEHDLLALAVDAVGNVYVTGSSPNWSGIVTIKYTGTGDTAWVRRYDGGGWAPVLAVDGGGNVYVTGAIYGFGYATIKYTSAGDTAWVRRFNGLGYGLLLDLAVDAGGNVFVTGSTSSGTANEYLTIKYSPAGDTLWVRHYKGPESNDYSTNIAIDAGGNVYVTGLSTWGYTRYYATVKYSPDGSLEWTAKTSGVQYSSGAPDIADSEVHMPNISVDNAGNVYVIGTYCNTVYYYMIIKYTQTVTSVHDESITTPSTFALNQNYPNPFNPSTTIRYALPHNAKVKLVIYDLLGREIETLMDEEQTAGWKEVRWDAKNISSGMYFYTLTVDTFTETKKMLLIK